MPRFLIFLGAFLIILGLSLPYLNRLGLGRLPGDIYIERENFRFYFPLATSLILSALISLILWALRR